jgi:sugar phosphate isomerase/epimerase
MNNAMESAGVKSAVMLTGGKGDVGDKDPKKRSKALATYKYWIDIASELNCKAMRNVCGENITIPHKEKLNYAIQGVKELGKYAASKGLDLLIENHNGYSSDPEWMTSLMKGVNLKNVGILGDFTNWTLERNPDTFYPDPYRGFEILAPYIRAISAKSESFDKNGEETTTDFKRMFSILKSAPNFIYAGVEFSGNGISRNQGSVNTRKLIEKVLRDY